MYMCILTMNTATFLKGWCRVPLERSWAGWQGAAAHRSGAWPLPAEAQHLQAPQAVSVGRSRGFLSCAAAQTKIPFFLCPVGSPSMRGPCPTNRNQTSVIAVSLIKLLSPSVRALWPLNLVRTFRSFLISSSFYGFDGNTAGKFILRVFLIYLKQEARLGNLQPKVLWIVWSVRLALNQNDFRLRFASCFNLELLLLEELVLHVFNRDENRISAPNSFHF